MCYQDAIYFEKWVVLTLFSLPLPLQMTCSDLHTKNIVQLEIAIPKAFFTFIQKLFVFLVTRTNLVWFQPISSHVFQLETTHGPNTCQNSTNTWFPLTFCVALASSQPKRIRMLYRFLLYTMVGICQDAPSSTNATFVIEKLTFCVNTIYWFKWSIVPLLSNGARRCHRSLPLGLHIAFWCHPPCDTQNSSP